MLFISKYLSAFTTAGNPRDINVEPCIYVFYNLVYVFGTQSLHSDGNTEIGTI
jgi:hypothetical protein